jgi:hypothetical protein
MRPESGLDLRLLGLYLSDRAVVPSMFNLLRSDDTEARKAAVRRFGRSHRSTQRPDAPRTCTYDAQRITGD